MLHHYITPHDLVQNINLEAMYCGKYTVSFYLLYAYGYFKHQNMPLPEKEYRISILTYKIIHPYYQEANCL